MQAICHFLCKHKNTSSSKLSPWHCSVLSNITVSCLAVLEKVLVILGSQVCLFTVLPDQNSCGEIHCIIGTIVLLALRRQLSPLRGVIIVGMAAWGQSLFGPTSSLCCPFPPPLVAVTFVTVKK